MKIALITDGLFPDVIGGMQKHSFFLVRYLARNEVHVDLYYTASDPGRNEALKRFTEAEMKYINPVFIPFPDKGSLPGHYIRESLAYSTAAYIRIDQRPEVDLIYAQGLTGWYCCQQRSRGKLNIPVAVNLHGMEMFQKAFGFKSKLQQLMLKGPARYILKHADFAYSLGGKLNKIIADITEESKIITQPIGIDQEWIKTGALLPTPPEAPCRFIFVGRDEKRKGLDILNEIMTRIDPDQAEFHIVGPIPKSNQIKAANIFYHHLITSEQEMKAQLDQCDVLVCPSFSEGMPTVILEAMARGLTVVASDVGAVSELVTEETGWLVEPGNLPQLESTLRQVINADHLLKKRTAALTRVQNNFSWDKIITDTIRGLKERIVVQNQNHREQ